ncbi:hypothetical protein MRB53_035099 [Persea americana]|uniref:Uncharacterized protein n=1 Tax=Persea americana TaxID=3435 RepID=A0ACC2K3W5_PERAE|nr:hypothetical protein MRB53_035099 [Persea americana]
MAGDLCSIMISASFNGNLAAEGIFLEEMSNDDEDDEGGGFMEVDLLLHLWLGEKEARDSTAFLREVGQGCVFLSDLLIAWVRIGGVYKFCSCIGTSEEATDSEEGLPVFSSPADCCCMSTSVIGGMVKGVV